MKEQFTTFEIAKQLNELGLKLTKEGSFGIFTMTGELIKIPLLVTERTIVAPLYQQVISFLKIKHNILIAEFWDGWGMAKEGDDFVVYKGINEAILKTIEIIKQK